MGNSKQENLAVHIISTPRSGSTLFMRVMAQALDNASIYSEPAVATYAIAHDPNWVPHLGYIDPGLRTFEGVEQRIIKEIQHGPVVVKDMIHTVNGFLTSKNSLLATHPDTQYLFLVRNPHAALVSLSKYTGELPDHPPGLISYEMLYSLHEHLAKVAVRQPMVIDGDNFFDNFPNTLTSLLNAIGASLAIDAAEQFKLTSLDTTTAIKDWSDPSNKETFVDWHGRAASETLVEPLPRYETNSGKPTFSEVDIRHREKYIREYEKALPFYQLFLGLAHI